MMVVHMQHQGEGAHRRSGEVMLRPILRHLLQDLPNGVSPLDANSKRVQDRRVIDLEAVLTLVRDARSFAPISSQRVLFVIPKLHIMFFLMITTSLLSFFFAEGDDGLTVGRNALPVVQSLVVIGGREGEDVIQDVVMLFVEEGSD